MQMTNGMQLEKAVNQWPELKQPILKKALSDLKIKGKKGLIF